MADQVRVFVSHHHSPEENTFTARLVTDLEAAGADVWVDTSGITSGSFVAKISQGLAGRQWLVLVMTPAALASPWVQREVDAALSEHTYGRMLGVLPLVMQPCREQDIPILWRTLHRYDATKDYTSGRDGVLGALGLRVPTPPQPPAERQDIPAPSPAHREVKRSPANPPKRTAGNARRHASTAQPDMNTIPGSFAGLQQAFQPQKAQGVNITIQFDFSGPEAGKWIATVNDGQFSYTQGAAQSPKVTITVSSDDWLKILRNELNAVSAFMGGRIKIQGDMGVMMQFQNWFARPS
jgi:putative sterol carrier protein